MNHVFIKLFIDKFIKEKYTVVIFNFFINRIPSMIFPNNLSLFLSIYFKNYQNGIFGFGHINFAFVNLHGTPNYSFTIQFNAIQSSSFLKIKSFYERNEQNSYQNCPCGTLKISINIDFLT